MINMVILEGSQDMLLGRADALLLVQTEIDTYVNIHAYIIISLLYYFKSRGWVVGLIFGLP